MSPYRRDMMKIRAQKLNGLFGETTLEKTKAIKKEPFKKELKNLNVDLDSLRNFLLLGAVEKETETLLNDIHGPSELPSRELLLTFKQTQSYWKGPTYFMGPKENFIIAINLAYHYRETISYYDRKSSLFKDQANKAGLSVSPISGEKAKLKTIARYFKASHDQLHEDPELETTLKLYHGIKHFDEARKCRSYSKEKSNDLLKKSKKHFMDLLRSGKESHTAITFLGIIEALLGRVEAALKFLVQAADIVFNPKPIYKLMAQLFKVIRMRNASHFYKKKSVSGHTRLCLVS